VGLVAAVVAGCQGSFPQTTFSPTSEFGESLQDLYLTIVAWAVLVFVVVEGLLIYVVVRFRARPGQPDPKPIHGHTALEMAWTLAPALIIVFIAVPTIRTIWRNASFNPDNSLRVEVVGHQWWWEFRYPEYGVVTANELHLPQGRPVVLEMTSADVIHSFWVPRLGGKRDVILGRVTRLAFAPDSVGVYLGQCAEFCGDSHANMRMQVAVEEAASFEQWVEQQRSVPAPADSLSELEQRGLEAFRRVRTPATHSCIACHTVAGVSAGVLGPNLTHLANRSTIAGGVLANTDDNLARWLRDPAEVKPGMGDQRADRQIIGMPDVELSEDEIAALLAYLSSLR
jgi:cytochrome c oxidase subunit 2